MINIFQLKKIISYSIASAIPLIVYLLFISGYGFLWTLSFTLIASIIGYFIFAWLLKNPFSEMLEGKGLLVFDTNSTGIISVFNLQLGSKATIRGSYIGNRIKQLYEQSMIFRMKAPKKIEGAFEIIRSESGEEKGIKIEMTPEMYAQARFGLAHYPVLLYNSQSNAFITKEEFSENIEKKLHENQLLHLNKEVRELANAIQDFQRGFLDKLFKNEGGGGSMSWVLWLFIIIVIGYLIYKYAPAVLGGFA